MPRVNGKDFIHRKGRFTLSRMSRLPRGTPARRKSLRGRFGDHSALAGVMPAAVGRTSPSVGRRDPLDGGRWPRR
ncbi:hypothetical protein J6590_088679 [Homalodisca vitripennis]|nr:hypothetical protein J6590_088679 [Homalodisca vitripennis]